MAGVFLMQPLGQLLAYAVGLIALSQLSDSKRDIDRLWRIVVGIGAAPTLLALFFRRNIPESWRFTYYVRKNPKQADNDIADVYGRSASPTQAAGYEMQQPAETAPQTGPDAAAATAPQASLSVPSGPGSQFRLKELGRYLKNDWPRLAAASGCWFLLDFAL